MKKIMASMLMLLALAAPVHAATTVLGIPFGERLTLSQCPRHSEDSSRICWVGQPSIDQSTGEKSGMIYAPHPDSRPKWAAYASFEIDQDKSGVVQRIKVQMLKLRDRYEIADSISRRFGSPYSDGLNRKDFLWASWRSAEGHVQLGCHTDCWVEFRTPSEQAAREKELAAREKTDAARPKAP